MSKSVLKLPLVALLLASGASVPLCATEPFTLRYRVEQTFRLEATTAQVQPVPGQLHAEPVRTAVEGRLRFMLEVVRDESPPAEDVEAPRNTSALQVPGGRGRWLWRFREVEVEGPNSDAEGAMRVGAEQAVAFALAAMKQLEGKEFTGSETQLPVLPLGESAPAWLTEWLRFAQTGAFSGREVSPVDFGGSEVNYQVRWLRSDFRGQPCHVQQARWTAPLQVAPGSISPQLEAEGVVARTHFAASSLEWVTQNDPQLVYAERSGIRETFWDLTNVSKPELQELVFRLRLALQVRVERLP